MAIQHYEGMLGEFDYDDTKFQIAEDYAFEHLIYIGEETDCSDLQIPYGLHNASFMFAGSAGRNVEFPPIIPDFVDCTEGMFRGCHKLKTVPVIPATVEYTGEGAGCDMFYECTAEIRRAGRWNIEHRGEDYYNNPQFEADILSDIAAVEKQYNDEISRLRSKLPRRNKASVRQDASADINQVRDFQKGLGE